MCSKYSKKEICYYISIGKLLEFDNYIECMEWYNTYDYQNFKNVKEMIKFLKGYIFTKYNKVYTILY